MKICIDPGHGGDDPGAPGGGDLTEATANIIVAERLVGVLHARGHDVSITRESGETCGLRRRAELANFHGADCFLSIHCNSHENPNAHGAEALYYPGSERGRYLADCVLSSWVLASGLRDRGSKPRGDLAVLRHTNMPAALLELGFLSNENDERLWDRANDDPTLANKLISAIADGIERWGRRYPPEPMGDLL